MQKLKQPCVSMCILSTPSALNSIENYYYHIEFRMDSMHIGTLCHVLLESLLGNICFNAQFKVSDVIMCMKCLTYFLIWFWMCLNYIIWTVYLV